MSTSSTAGCSFSAVPVFKCSFVALRSLGILTVLFTDFKRITGFEMFWGKLLEVTVVSQFNESL